MVAALAAAIAAGVVLCRSGRDRESADRMAAAHEVRHFGVAGFAPGRGPVPTLGGRGEPGEPDAQDAQAAPAAADTPVEAAEAEPRGDDRVSFVATSCDPDPRVLSLPERRWIPAELKPRVREVLERSRQRSRDAVAERYAEVFGRQAPDRASTDELATALWAVLAPSDRARAAEAVGGAPAPGPARLFGVDHVVAELAREPERTLDDLTAAIGAEAADQIWAAEVLSWCAFSLPL